MLLVTFRGVGRHTVLIFTPFLVVVLSQANLAVASYLPYRHESDLHLPDWKVLN